MGWLPRWLRLVAVTRTAWLVNFLASVRPLAAVGKWLGGIAAERKIPRVAGETFTRWSKRRLKARVREMRAGRPAGWEHERPRGGTAIVWPDTFTDHLAPSVGRAAVRVLEAAGLFVVPMPGKTMNAKEETDEDGTVTSYSFSPWRARRVRVCCGLTYVSTGQLDRARAVLRDTLDVLDPFLDPKLPEVLGDLRVPEDPDDSEDSEGPVAPMYFVVLEPSCAAALRTDLPELLPDDPRAARLAASVLTFAEALDRLAAPDWTPPRIDRPVTGQTHCHQHAVLGDTPDRRVRAAAGLTGELAGGCCGLAGNFGFEKGHYEVSAACAEEQLLPAVREAPEGAVVLADGFSCRTQLEQMAGVRGRHLAEVLAEALDSPEGGGTE